MILDGCVTVCVVCPVSCGADQFTCGPQADRRCIPSRYVCDGENDCGDQSDEAAETCGQLLSLLSLLIL